MKNWKPLWHFLLDTTITNCYKLHHFHPQGLPFNKRYEQKEFRTKLAIELFNHSERTTSPPGNSTQTHMGPLIQYVIPDVASQYQHVLLSQVPKACVPCKVGKRRPAETTKKRKALGELSYNVQRPNQANKKRKAERKKSRHGCKLCGIYICKKGSCWEEHLNSV